MTQQATTWRRLSAYHSGEIEWFMSGGDSLGLRSNLGGQLDAMRAKLGRQTQVHDTSDAELARAMRAAKVSRALRLCSTRSQMVLRAYFGPGSFLSRRLMQSLAPLGRMGAPMLFTTSIAKWREHRPELGDRGRAHALETLSMSARAGDAAAIATLAKVRHEADSLFQAACDEYTRHACSDS